MRRNRLLAVPKYCSPTGRRYQCRPLEKLLDMWDRNGPTGGRIVLAGWW